ncbi:MAG: PSD1 and planctomycete cytochrome C domain-containing protein [Bryobacteraceae bacterium]|nr:PSD1 and planctomycete cytochrome C domain-containing protein [Bryobacteraceae bacterium]
MSARWVLGLFCAVTLAPAEPAAEQLEFFEKRVRPVLVKNCYACHSKALAQPMGGLRVDSSDGMARVLAPGQPEASTLYKVLTYQYAVKMPPSGKLPPDQVADIAAWIRMGAPYPRAQAAGSNKHWAFQPVSSPQPPAVKNRGWVQTPVDAFLLQKLEEAGLRPAAPADKRILIRRATFDLTGLPPSPEDVRAFLDDTSPDAFAKVVDRLLASPHYGERWARHWLDLVRYAETNGHEYDNDKLAPWRYRDYVIRAFNLDLPYDQFVREHIAGDLMPSPRLTSDGAYEESPIGTTAFWFGEVLNSATDSVKSRADDVDNQIDVIGKTFQGLTVACARCHDHKFDPIPTADYYALAGVFHSTGMRERVIDSAAQSQFLRSLSEKLRALPPAAARPTPPAVSYRPEDKVFARFNGRDFDTWTPSGIAFGEGPRNGAADSLAAGSEKFVGTLTSPRIRTGKELFLHVRLGGTKGEAQLRENAPIRFTSVCDGYKGQHLFPKGDAAAEWQTLRLTFERERDCYYEIVDHSREGSIFVEEIAFSHLKDPPPTAVLGAPGTTPSESAERLALESKIPESAFATVASDFEPHDVKLHVRGSHLNLGETVPRRFLQVVAGEKQRPIQKGSGRLQIAEWIASRSNPLTARVMVNRIWRHHFGYGLVRTADNFGATGDRPSHPELLDYLATQFVEGGWSVKKMHRLILLSGAYRMSSRPEPAAQAKDPANRLLHHMPVRRLEGEAIRDAMLAVSGSLRRELFGPSVPPHISSYQDGRGKPKSGPLDGNGRRSIYIQVRRNFLTPLLVAFDYPPPISTIGARGSSTVPSQALLMMNNELVADQAAKWAARAEANPDPVAFLYETAFARPPSAPERTEIEAFVKQGQSLTDVAHVLFNSPEFIYIP